MTIRRIQVTQSVLPGKRLVEVSATRMVAKSGDDVILKTNVPPEFNKYKNLVGKWQGQVGNFSHVHFEGVGTVSIQSSYLLMM